MTNISRIKWKFKNRLDDGNCIGISFWLLPQLPMWHYPFELWYHWICSVVLKVHKVHNLYSHVETCWEHAGNLLIHGMMVSPSSSTAHRCHSYREYLPRLKRQRRGGSVPLRCFRPFPRSTTKEIRVHYVRESFLHPRQPWDSQSQNGKLSFLLISP